MTPAGPHTRSSRAARLDEVGEEDLPLALPVPGLGLFLCRVYTSGAGWSGTAEPFQRPTPISPIAPKLTFFQGLP
ncbi:hypothetical protein MTO96_002414 [Rhipicephalus appendiculatus]